LDGGPSPRTFDERAIRRKSALAGCERVELSALPYESQAEYDDALKPFVAFELSRRVSNLDARLQLKSFDMTAFRGQAVRIFFSAKEDQGSLTSFVIDDVKLVIE
jgi:hypothetical protein